MAKFNKEDFVKELLNQVDSQIAFVESLKSAVPSALIFKDNQDKWNVLECIEHMNNSMQIYTDQLTQKQLKETDEGQVKIGWKGNFFAEGMRPKGEKISYKMKTMKNLEPVNSDNSSINRFIALLELIKGFVTENQQNDWTKAKVNTALGSFVKLNIAEAINFVLAHNERHILQAKKAMTKMVEV